MIVIGGLTVLPAIGRSPSCLATMMPPVTFRAGMAKAGLLAKAERKVMKMIIWAMFLC